MNSPEAAAVEIPGTGRRYALPEDSLVAVLCEPERRYRDVRDERLHAMVKVVFEENHSTAGREHVFSRLIDWAWSYGWTVGGGPDAAFVLGYPRAVSNGELAQLVRRIRRLSGVAEVMTRRVTICSAGWEDQDSSRWRSAKIEAVAEAVHRSGEQSIALASQMRELS